MEICIKWNICRLCLQEEQKRSATAANGINQKMQHLFKAEKNIALHIYKLSGITMKPGDSLPEKICNRCVSSIDKAIQFRKTCRASDIYLHSILDRTKSASTLFKPDMKTYQVSDDELDVASVETQPSSLFDTEIESNKFETENKNIGEQLVNKEHQNADGIQNLEQQEKVIEREATEIISNDKMELEVIIDLSDEVEDTLENIRKERNLQPRYITEYNIENSNIKSCETSQLEKFHMNKNFSTLKNKSEKYDNDNDLVEIVKTKKNADEKNSFSNNENHNIHEFEISTSDEEFLDEDVKKVPDSTESILKDLEKNIIDNQYESPVSSTVDTNNQNEYYENNSNLINDLDEGCLIDENPSTGHMPSTKPSKDISEANLRTIRSCTDMANELYICHICGKEFTTQSQMNDHIQVHLLDKTHPCPLCSKRFTTGYNLRIHMRRHTGERPYKCQYCDKGFATRRVYIRHQRTHTKEKPYECAECGKRFCMTPSFGNHMKNHKNERLFRCEPCGKDYNLTQSLRVHKQTLAHKSQLESINLNKSERVKL